MPYDIMQYLRNRNIFGAGGSPYQPPYTPPTFGGGIDPIEEERKRQEALLAGQPTQQTTTQQPQPSSMDNTVSAYGKLMTAEPGPAQKTYRDFLSSNLPDRESFKPTKMQRLTAMLTGASEGLNRGGAAGYKTAQGILDEPYNEAVSKYKLQAGKLAESANLEEKDINNRIKTYRDILQDEASRRTNERQQKLTDAQIANYDSLAKSRTSEASVRGWTRTTDAAGNILYTRINPAVAGGIEVKHGDKIRESPDEQSTRRANDAKTASKIILGRQESLFNYTEPKKTANEIAKEERAAKQKAISDKAINDRAEANRNAAANTPQREFQARSLAYQKIRETHPELKDKITIDPVTNALTSTDPQVQKLLKEELDTRKRSTTTDNTAPPTGAKPGGKWITTKSGSRVYQEPD